MKPCKKCGSTERSKGRNCIPCKREWARKYAAENAAKRLALKRAWRKANPELARERARKRYAENRTRKQETSRRWAVANPGKVRSWKGLPVETRPMPELCEVGCGRPAKCLDHCHTTGAFRGWLCGPCNSGLGMLGDTQEALQRAAAYLVAAQSEMWLAIPGCGLPRKQKCL